MMWKLNYVFYPCKLINTLLKIGDVINFHYLRIAYIQGQQRVSGRPSAATGSWFVLMDEVLGQRPSTAPPVLTASIPEDTPGPSDQEEQEDSQPGPRRKRRREDEGGHEAAERIERLFSAPKDNPYIITVVI